MASSAPAAPPPASAPAAAPSTAAAPATGQPSATPATAQPSTGAKPPAAAPPPINEAFAEIDKIIADSQQKRPQKPAAKPAEKPADKPADKPAAAQTEKPGEKPAEKPAELDPAKDPDVQRLKTPELAKAYVNNKRELHGTKEKLAAAETRLKELEAKASELSNLSAIQEKLTATERRAQDLEQQIKFVDYEKSPEYKEKYYAPFLDAYQAGRAKVASLKTREVKDPNTEEVIQPRRQATEEDFDNIMRIQDDGEAAEAADRLFGPLSNLVIYHREKVMELNRARVKAIEDYKAKGGEREKQTAAQISALQEKVKNTFQASVQAGVEKYPQWFKAEEGDEDGKVALEKGMLNADTIFSNSKLDPEVAAQRHAAFRNMAGAFPYVALKLHRAEAKIAELEKELGEFKKSELGGGGVERGEKSGELSVDDEIDALAGAGRR